jgi:REP element-mobilizing transposase RayT
VRWRQDLRIQDFLRELKSASSGWVHKTFPHLRAFAWQKGYGAFSVSHSQSDRVKRYIAGQEDHHRRRDFNQEFIGLLRRHEIEYDEERIWD